MMIMKGCGEDSGSATGDLAPDPRGAADYRNWACFFFFCFFFFLVSGIIPDKSILKGVTTSPFSYYYIFFNKAAA